MTHNEKRPTRDDCARHAGAALAQMPAVHITTAYLGDIVRPA